MTFSTEVENTLASTHLSNQTSSVMIRFETLFLDFEKKETSPFYHLQIYGESSKEQLIIFSNELENIVVCINLYGSEVYHNSLNL